MSESQAKLQTWYVYMIRCADGSLYTGITTNPTRRLRQHSGEIKGGARYTRSRGPLQLVFLEECEDRSRASKREAQIKSLSVKEKQALLRPDFDFSAAAYRT